jgi:hypothetical protein
MTCSLIKFVWNHVVYCGEEHDGEDVVRIAREEAHLAHKIDLDLAADVRGKGHIINMEFFFTSVGLLHELASSQIYATDTVRTNQIGLPLPLKNAITLKNTPEGSLEWGMHQSRQMAFIVWKNKKPILLLSTHTIPVGFSCMLMLMAPRKNGVVRKNIMTSRMHLEYTTHMRGVNVADQFRASYSTQNCTYKWWQRIFFFSWI